MYNFSTSEAARKLGLHPASLARYIAAGKVPAPKVVITGKTTTHIWTDEDIERVRTLLPNIANGRKTRYRKNKQAKTKKK
ncbi:MAG TPA: MerR family transcriptional regulator [Candidatus Angelobacter sp.]|nr:MerR family transcriptional regulator [Candidatus Angelobacter sp.]